VARLRELRSSRDSGAVHAGLDAVAAAARGTDNVLPPIKEALAVGATLGEICATLKEVWGSYEPK